MSIIDTIEKISDEMNELFNFAANDETLSKEFEEYLAKNEIEASTQTQLCNILTNYLLDVKPSALNNYANKNEITASLKDSFCSVFEIKKVEKNSFLTYSLTNEREFTLFPLVKMTHLRTICRGDFIKARIVKVDGNYFLLEIFDALGSSRTQIARKEAVKLIIEMPKCAYWDNAEKLETLKKSANYFVKKFKEYFGKSVVSTTNKKIDELLESFNVFCQNGEKTDYSALLEEPPEYKYFELGESEDFMQGVAGGFGRHSEIYDVSLLCDEKRGIFVIPFYETILRTKDDKAKERIIEKCESSDFSPITILFNSKTFSQMMGYKEEEPPRAAERNEPCPCGSGKKYKKCCIR